MKMEASQSSVSKCTKNVCSFVSSLKQDDEECVCEVGVCFGGRGEKNIKKIKNNTFLLVCFNAPKLPGGMNLWLSPSGLHSHLLSNLLKNGPERKKQKEPFRLRHLRAWKKCVFSKGGGKRGEEKVAVFSLSLSFFW